MELFQALVLGLIQGITEWLPVSSQGQVIVSAVALFGIAPAEALNYSIFLHIGTLFAAALYFRHEIKKIIGSVFGGMVGGKGQNEQTANQTKKLVLFLLIAVLATAITAVPCYIFLKKTFALAGANLIMAGVGVLLVVTGLLQYANKKIKGAGLTKKNALLLGLGQGFSVLPGISRSGTTTAVLLFEGFKPQEALRLSFLLSIPSVFAAEILFFAVEPGAVAFGLSALAALAASAVVGFLSIKFLLSVAGRINFAWFCFIFGLLYVAAAMV